VLSAFINKSLKLKTNLFCNNLNVANNKVIEVKASNILSVRRLEILGLLDTAPTHKHHESYYAKNLHIGTFEVFTAVTMENAVFWNKEPNSYFTGATLLLRYRAQPVNAM
jgi:hypothetical protein